MISYVTYKTLHFIGLAMVLLSLGALLSQPQTLSKRLLAMVHGIGLLLLLVTGFGMLAKLGIHSIPGWVGGKLVVWLGFGGAMAVVPRWRAKKPALLLWSLVGLVGLASYFAGAKPF